MFLFLVCYTIKIFIGNENVCNQTNMNTESAFLCVKGILHFFLERGSFYNYPRVKVLSFTVFGSIQPISGSGGTTFSIA